MHHIFPREMFPQYEWEPWNLISVCQEKHDSLHARESHELTEAGKDLLRKTARKNGIRIPENI